jgi:hypothetical protein
MAKKQNYPAPRPPQSQRPQSVGSGKGVAKAQQGKQSAAGGGAKMRTVPVRYGAPAGNKAEPGAVGRLGRAVGDHASDSVSSTTRPNEPLYQGTKPNPSRFGNEMAAAAHAGKSGDLAAGRIMHGKSGSQSLHGPSNPGLPDGSGPGVSGGPGSMGFTGKGKVVR